MLEFLNSLTWPAVFVTLGSIVTIVVGLFGYLRSAKTQTQISTQTPADLEKLHSRINIAVERVAVNEGDLKEVRASLRAALKQIADHEQRDIDDFKMIDTKLDRLMDIIVRILQDEQI